MSFAARSKAKLRRAPPNSPCWLVSTNQTHAVGIRANLNTTISTRTTPFSGSGNDFKDDRQLVVQENTLSGIGKKRSQFNVDADGIKPARYYLNETNCSIVAGSDGYLVCPVDYVTFDEVYAGYVSHAFITPLPQVGNVEPKSIISEQQNNILYILFRATLSNPVFYMAASNPFLSSSSTYTITITADGLIAIANYTQNGPTNCIELMSINFSSQSTFLEICKRVVKNKTPFRVNISVFECSAVAGTGGYLVCPVGDVTQGGIGYGGSAGYKRPAVGVPQVGNVEPKSIISEQSNKIEDIQLSEININPDDYEFLMVASNPFLLSNTYTITITADGLIATASYTPCGTYFDIQLSSNSFSSQSTFLEIGKRVVKNKTPFRVNISVFECPAVAGTGGYLVCPVGSTTHLYDGLTSAGYALCYQIGNVEPKSIISEPQNKIMSIVLSGDIINFNNYTFLMEVQSDFLSSSSTYTITITAGILIATANYTPDGYDNIIQLSSINFSSQSIFVDICKDVLTNKTPFRVNITQADG